MTSARRLWVPVGLAALALNISLASQARAQQGAGLNLIKGGSTPAAIQGLDNLINSCPLLVKPADAALQPLRIPAAQVDAKNKLGCLSSADAIYGPDGCPSKLCGAGKGVIPLPAGVTPATPQLPQP